MASQSISENLREKFSVSQKPVMIKSVASLNFRAMLVLVFLALVLQTQMGKSQTDQKCAASLANLNTCSQFVLPGTPNDAPNQACCAALQAIDQGCICSSMQIASRLPSKCNIPSITCAAGN